MASKPYIPYNVIKAVVDLSLGLKPHIECKTSKSKYIVNNFIYCNPGIFDHLEEFEELKQNSVLHDYYLFKSKGTELSSIDSSGDRIAGYTVCAESLEELSRKHKETNSKIRVIDSNNKDMMRHDLITEI